MQREQLSDAEIDKKIEDIDKHQREIPNGRSFLWNTWRFQNNKGYRDKFDSIFPDAPGKGI